MTHKRSLRWLFLSVSLLLVLAAASPMRAQLLDRFGGGFGGVGPEDEQVVTVEGEFTTPTAKEPARLFITAKLAPGYHIYSITQAPGGPKRTKIKPDLSGEFELLGDFQPLSTPEKKKEGIWADPNLITQTHHDSITWYAPIELAEGVDPAGLRITGQVYAQACSTGCLMPQDYPFTAVLGQGMEVPAGRADTVGSEPLPRSPYSFDTLVHLLLALAAGVSINVLPCVLPVVPIILMRLFEQSKESSGERLAKGIALCLGIVLFFAVFALVSAVISAATGAALNLNDLYRYPSVVVTLFLGLILFGLMMLDVVPLLLPSSIAGRQSTGTGLGASLGTGFFVAILSIPCSGPMLGTALGWAQTQERLVGSAALLLMGVGMALPYAIIVAYPALLSWLPKPGVWMEIFKKSCGFLLFLIAVKLSLAALPKDRLVNVLMYGVIFSFCLWMWGKWVNVLTPPARKWSIRGIAVAIGIGSGLWLLPSHALPEGAGVDWQLYDAARIEAARSKGQAVLLKFTADWCSDCRVVERRVYHNAEVVRQLRNKGVLAIKADTTQIDFPATRDFRNVYGEAGAIPVSILLVPGRSPVKLRGVFEKGQLLAHIEKLPDVGQPVAWRDAMEAASEETAKRR